MISDTVELPPPETLPDDQRLPILLLSQYLYFLSRRPVSESNLHYLVSRLQGLQSLAPLFTGSGRPALDRVVGQLGHLHPAAFRRIAASLQLSLLPLANAARPLPGDVVVQDSAPGTGWLDDVRRALLIFGPGIGIGDELILAPLPKWLKRVNGSLEVTTLSAYEGFWNRVSAVDGALHYSSHIDLLKALRGTPPYENFDLVVFADFEAPELYRGVVHEGRLRKYLEISLGSRSGFYFDRERRWLNRLFHFTPYFSNYYAALHQLLRLLGLRPESVDRFANVVRRKEEKVAGRLDVFVCPFTSKYDPSGVYWGRLLTGVAQGIGPFPVALHLDTGKTWRTQRFTLELARSVAPMLPPNVEIHLARDGVPPSLSLPRVYDYLDRCHAVICADSFAAHAAPLFDCLTLVLAKAELRDWQVPSEGSFYFDPDWPVAEVAAAMGNLLRDTLHPKSALELAASFSQAELSLGAWGDELSAAFSDEGMTGAFADLYRRFAEHHRAVAQRRRNGGGELLFRDSFVDDVRAPDSGQSTPAMLLHLRDQFERWQNTNFAKYLRRSMRQAGDGAGESRLPPIAHAAVPAEAHASQMGGALVKAIQSILREQLPSGEVATYFRFGNGALEYRRSPLISSFVHDALGSFDLHSRWVDTEFLDVLPSGVQGRFVRAAALVRSRIRRFLLWEEANEGGWRFHGRVSGMAPDVDTTACAAAAVLQAPRRKPSPRWRSHAAAVAGNGDVRDLVARVNVLRFLALIGEPVDELAADILTTLRDGGAKAMSGRYVHPFVPAFCVARAWAHAALPRRGEVAEVLIPEIVSGTNGAFDSPLGAALALNALLDLEYSGPETIAAGQYLLDSALPRGGWGYAALLESGGGAPACTSALAMAALARSGVGR